MWLFIFKAFYLAWPAYLANMAPVIFASLGWLKSLARPIDGGKKIGATFIFGPNKTWRGLVAGVIGGLVASLIQLLLYQTKIFYQFSLFDYTKSWFLIGALGGLGAILGDLAKSFLKRRIKIKAGDSWPFFDQLDFIIGFFIFTYWLTRPPLAIVITVCLLTLILHPLTNLTAYFLKIKKVWW